MMGWLSQEQAGFVPKSFGQINILHLIDRITAYSKRQDELFIY